LDRHNDRNGSIERFQTKSGRQHAGGLKKGGVSMLGLTRWTPLGELASLHRDLDSLFGRVFEETTRPQTVDSIGAFTPAADVKRDGDKWMISMAIPGIAPEQVEINVVARTLRVRGERGLDKDREKVQPILSEISYGRFEREFTLPEDIDSEKVQATYRHGMLELMLPLKEGAKPRRIEVDVTPEAKQLQAA
jgi:HSP20 family protein